MANSSYTANSVRTQYEGSIKPVSVSEGQYLSSFTFFDQFNLHFKKKSQSLRAMRWNWNFIIAEIPYLNTSASSHVDIIISSTLTNSTGLIDWHVCDCTPFFLTSFFLILLIRSFTSSDLVRLPLFASAFHGNKWLVMYDESALL